MALPVGQSLHLPRRGDGTIWTPDRIIPVSGIYDLTLGGARSFPSAELTGGQAAWPNAPVTNQTINVTAGSFTSLQNAVAISGARVIVPAGTYAGTLHLDDSDVDVVVDNGAIIDGTIEFGNFLTGPSRVRWSGGRHIGAVGGRVYIRNCVDLLIDNLNSDSGEGMLMEGAIRFALINSTFNSGFYAVLSQSFSDHQDHIYANNLFTTTSPNQATVRLMSMDRLIFVDNRSVSGAGNRALRLHYKMLDAWVANNEFIAQTPASHMWLTENGGNGNTYGPFGPLYVADNVIYSDQNFYADTDIGPVGTEIPGGPIYVYNNISYNNNFSVNSNFVNEVSTAGLTWSGNTRLPYQAPPAFSGGADH